MGTRFLLGGQRCFKTVVMAPPIYEYSITTEFVHFKQVYCMVSELHLIKTKKNK